CELGSHKCPHIACVSESVKQHDCRALSADSDMNCRAVGLNLLSTEVGRNYGLSTCVGSIERGEGCVGSLDDHRGYVLRRRQHWNMACGESCRRSGDMRCDCLLRFGRKHPVVNGDVPRRFRRPGRERDLVGQAGKWSLDSGYMQTLPFK